MKFKTNEEKKALRRQSVEENYVKIAVRYYDYIRRGETKTDAVLMCADDFCCSLPRVYAARKYYEAHHKVDGTAIGREAV